MNDLYPEEQDPDFEELIALLRHDDLNPSRIDPGEHEQMIANARARLFPKDTEMTQPEISELVSLPIKPMTKRGRHGILVRLINVIAAVLVVALLVGSALLFFGPLLRDRLSAIPSKGTFGAPRKVGNLEMRLRITPGPYFLNELLEVDLVVTNPTHTTDSLAPARFVDPTCAQLLDIVTTGGGSPHALDFQYYWTGPLRTPNCSPLASGMDPAMGIPVSAHQTLTYQQYVQLTSSGYVTLTAKLGSLRVYAYTRSGVSHPSNIVAGALDGTLQLFVSPHASADRQLSVKEQKGQVVVSGPPAVRGRLFGRIGSVCPGSGGGTDIGGLGQPPGTTVVLDTLVVGVCGDNGPRPLWWTYVVGVPGYTLVAGKVNGS